MKYGTINGMKPSAIVVERNFVKQKFKHVGQKLKKKLWKDKCNKFSTTSSWSSPDKSDYLLQY